MDPLTSMLLILGCLALSAFFSGSETALLRLNPGDVDAGVRTARTPASIAVRDLLSSTSRLLVTILLGNNVVNILAASVAAALAVQYLGGELGIAVATILMTSVVLVFCEILPKAVAASHPRRISGVVALPLYLLHQSLRPMHYVFDHFIEPFVNRVAGSSGEHATSPEQILRLARQVREEHPAGSPLAIMGATAGAAEMTVAEIMVPRTEIVAFSVQTPPAQLLENVLAERYTRVPIYENDIDHLLGVVHLKDLIGLVRSGKGDLRSTLKPLIRVPERKPILRLLAEMQRGFVHVAIVKDEFNVTLGLVTQEDILEEIVGEIRDEFDREELLTIRPSGDGTYQALGRVKVLDFNRETGEAVPAESGDSLSGLAFNALGRTPQVGDSVEVGDYRISVVDMSGSRIIRVQIARRDRPKLKPVSSA
ncbi:MAG: HlyC/CorC family transporter [Deltaproteobacteria bacterium]|nr:MAG: HlyC/CorC family transporter [Deltaproteobacteria bacterium]